MKWNGSHVALYARGILDFGSYGEVSMSRQNHAFVTELSLLMVCLIFLGCGSSESIDARVAQFNKTANAQTSHARESPPMVEVDQTGAQSIFVNATEVAPADRHVVFDFGLKPLPGDGGPTEPTTSVRIYLNYYTAKRMQMALLMTIERHVDVFGPIGQDEPAKMQAPPQVALRPNYANFVRITGTPEELVIEMGLNPMPVGVPTEPIPVSVIVIMDFQTGNTLLRQVGSVLDQYETEHGPIETDVQERVVGGSVR